MYKNKPKIILNYQSYTYRSLYFFSVRLDLGQILGGIANAGQQNNNNKDPIGNLLSNPNVQQGIQSILTNPDVQQGIASAVGINLPRPQVTTPSPRPTTIGIHLAI